LNNKLITFLDKILGPHREYSGNEMYYKCPLCQKADGKKKLAIKLDPSAKDKDGNSIYLSWHCWRDTSHKGKNLFQLLKRMKASDSEFNELKSLLGTKGSLKNFDDSVKSSLNTQSKYFAKAKGLPEEFISFKNVRDNPHYKNAYRYITKDRGVSVEDIIKYNIGYCETGKYAGYIIIPSYDADMNVNYFVARSFYKSGMKHKNPPFKKDTVFNELYINWKERITLVEGVFDAITIKRNAIPILGKYIQPALKIKMLQNKVKEICVCLDSDAIKDSIKIIEEFMKNNISVYYIDLPKKDPNEIGFKIITLLLKDAKLLSYKDLIKMKINL
jgi:hypothetical protein